MQCLFCSGLEKNYKPETDKEFICGSCVQLLLQADQADLRRAYQKAIERGYTDKARAIESFLEEEEFYGETERPESSMIRKRTMRTVRPARNQIR